MATSLFVLNLLLCSRVLCSVKVGIQHLHPSAGGGRGLGMGGGLQEHFRGAWGQGAHQKAMHCLKEGWGLCATTGLHRIL